MLQCYTFLIFLHLLEGFLYWQMNDFLTKHEDFLSSKRDFGSTYKQDASGSSTDWYILKEFQSSLAADEYDVHFSSMDMMVSLSMLVSCSVRFTLSPNPLVGIRNELPEETCTLLFFWIVSLMSFELSSPSIETVTTMFLFIHNVTASSDAQSHWNGQL